MQLDRRRSSSSAQGDRCQCWLQVHAPPWYPTTQVMSHTCVRAARSVLSCLCQGLLILCASSHCTPPRRCSQRQMSSPVTRSSDPHVFFAYAWLVWSGWLAPWPRSSRIPISLSALRASAGLSASICSMSAGRTTCGPTSRNGHARPMRAGSGCLLHELLVSG